MCACIQVWVMLSHFGQDGIPGMSQKWSIFEPPTRALERLQLVGVGREEEYRFPRTLLTVA